MPFEKDITAPSALGGTEIMKNSIEKFLPTELLENFQIFVSRVNAPLSENHVRILWLQDLADDPATEHLFNNGWQKFHRLVFSSHWQMRGYIEKYNIPWSKCVVIKNGIEPISFDKKPDRDKIKLIYTPTPHRGLNILYAVFDKLSQEYDNIELDVYSSFKLYGWPERDVPYQKLFELLEKHPKINYHGTVSNEEIRKALTESHIFAYPSIWQETSCMCLMEAMSAGNICVHPNLGALYETSANWTYMYQWHEEANIHANLFYSVLKAVIEDLKNLPEETYMGKILTQKSYIDIFNNIEYIRTQWKSFLESIKDLPKELPEMNEDVLVYKTK